MKNNDTQLKSTLIYGGSRTYFFDVKSNPNGQKYLVVSENKPNCENHQIVILEEHLPFFIKGLQKLLPEFGIENELLTIQHSENFAKAV